MVPCAEPPPGEGWWQDLAELGSAGLPTLYRRAVEAALVWTDGPKLMAVPQELMEAALSNAR